MGRSGRALVSRIADAVSWGWCGSITATLENIRPAPGSVILVFDEAQNIKDGLLREILDLNEWHSLPIILCGNDRVLRYHHATDSALAQIGVRLGMLRIIPGIETGDADNITNHFVSGTWTSDRPIYDPMRAVAEVRQTDGVIRVLKLARDFAGPGNPIRMEHVESALLDIPPLTRRSRETTRSTARGRR